MDLKERINLTDIEETFLSYDLSSPSNVAAVAHLEGIQDVDMVEKALNIAKDRHPYLQYFIERDGDHSVLVYDPVKSVPFTVLPESPEEFWIQICEAEMNRVFDIKNAPMMKAFLLYRTQGSSELIVSFSHIIADGVNAVQFVRDVIYLLGKMTEGEKTPAIEKLQLLRPDTAYFSEANFLKPVLSTGPFEKNNYIVQSFRPDIETGDSKFNYISGGSDKKSKLLPYILSPAESSHIVNRCREQGITVNSLLSIALIFALGEYIYEKDMGDADPLWIKISIAMDLRRRMRNIQVSASDFGMWAGRCLLYSQIAKDTIQYNFSRSYHAIFSEYLQNHPFYYSQMMVQQFYQSLNTATKNSLPYFPHVKITNLGDLNKTGIMSHYGRIKVHRMGFVAPLHREWINDLGFGLCAAGFDGQLILNFIYMEPARTADEARLFVDRVIKHMNF
jgi:NRPS condensation-like uncharacterized protein